MKVFLDTNVLIASLIANGLCRQLFEHCVVNHEIFSSEFVLAELHEKLTLKFKYSAESADSVIELFRERFEIVRETSLPASVSRDPDDDNILAASSEGDCDVIVSGDKDLLVIERFGKARILSPREFIEFERIG